MSIDRPAFKTLALNETVLKVLQAKGFSRCTPVQAATITCFQRSDVSVESATGTGKTLAFLLPAFEILLKRNPPFAKGEVGAIIISPTRELARQTLDVATAFIEALVASEPRAKDYGLLCLTGGTDIKLDRRAFKQNGGTIVVATPGKLDGLIQADESFSNGCRALEVLVLDEADKLLSMGQQARLDAILSKLPKQRRTGIFSATQTQEVLGLARAGLKSPISIQLNKTLSQLKNFYIINDWKSRLNHLVHFLLTEAPDRSVVYVPTCSCVEYFSRLLSFTSLSSRVFALHGKLSQSKRSSTYSQYLSSQTGILLCTDLASRGLDMPAVRWVIQLTPPQDPDTYVHRVGRTARNGAAGRSLLYLLSHEDAYVELLQVRKVPIAEDPSLTFDDSMIDDNRSLWKDAILQDRELVDLGTAALVSYVQSYSKHVARFILDMKKLDIVDAAIGFGLLRLPKMPELRGKDVSLFPACEIDVIDQIPYKDKLIRKKKENEKKTAVERKKAFKEKKQKKEEVKKLQPAISGKKRKERNSKRDWEDFSKEERLAKKLKRGKISLTDFEEALGEANIL